MATQEHAVADIQQGDDAPDFELRDSTGQPVRLSDYRGKKAVVLVFFPFAFTRTCTTELCSIRDQIDHFRNDDVETLAISVDSPAALRVFGEREGYQFPLLADFWPHGEVAQRYGVFDDRLGSADRATFVIDRDGTVVYAVHRGIGDVRDEAEYVAALEGIGAL